MGAYTRAAYIAKPKSLNGWVVCRAAGGFPFALKPGLTVHFVPPTLKGPRCATVEEVRSVRNDVWDVRFAEIDTVESAQELAGCFCLALSDDVSVEACGAQSVAASLVGYTLIEAIAGEVGIVVDVQTGPAQDLLVVETSDGNVLVPAVDAFLGPKDEQAKTVHATLPPGLLELR